MEITRDVRRFLHDLVAAGALQQVRATNEKGEPGYMLVVDDKDEFERRLRQYLAKGKPPR
jgi:hypothetical protein